MTPSAVSQHMTALANEAGVDLLEKSGRSVRLTSAGKRLVGHTERVLEVLEEAQADLDEISHGCAFVCIHADDVGNHLGDDYAAP